MTKFTFIFLATLFYLSEPAKKENLYSWQITFDSFERCEMFFDNYGDKLLNGVVYHGTKKFGKPIGVEYLSCAMVEVSPNFTQPRILGQKIMYQR